MGYVRNLEPFAYSGWRLQAPGEPAGGQYHGYFGGFPDPADNVFRSSAEPPPRMNANGDQNVTDVHHSTRRPIFRLAGLGQAASDAVINPLPNRLITFNRFARPVYPPFTGVVSSPAQPGQSVPFAIVPQPPPPTQPQPSPTVCTGPNMYVDAAGNCTSDWHNPYSLYLPRSPAPAPTVAASPADYLPSQGQPLVNSTGQTFSDWMQQQSIWPGVNNEWILGGGLVLAALLFARRGKR